MTPANETARRFLAEGIVEKLHAAQLILVGENGKQIGETKNLMASAWDFDLLDADHVFFYHPEVAWVFDRGGPDVLGWQLWKGGLLYAADFEQPLSISAMGSAVKLRPSMRLSFTCEEI